MWGPRPTSKKAEISNVYNMWRSLNHNEKQNVAVECYRGLHSPKAINQECNVQSTSITKCTRTYNILKHGDAHEIPAIVCNEQYPSKCLLLYLAPRKRTAKRLEEQKARRTKMPPRRVGEMQWTVTLKCLLIYYKDIKHQSLVNGDLWSGYPVIFVSLRGVLVFWHWVAVVLLEIHCCPCGILGWEQFWQSAISALFPLILFLAFFTRCPSNLGDEFRVQTCICIFIV